MKQRNSFSGAWFGAVLHFLQSMCPAAVVRLCSGNQQGKLLIRMRKSISFALHNYTDYKTPLRATKNGHRFCYVLQGVCFFPSVSLRTISTSCSIIVALLLVGEGRLKAQELNLTRFDRYIQSEVSRRGIPGVAVAVTQGKEVVFAKGYGVRNLSTGAPVTEDTLFHIGSTNKSVTALLTATLVDKGYLRWSSTAEGIVGAGQFSDFAIDEVQLSQLLSMTGGFIGEDEDLFYDEYGDGGTPEQLMEFIKRLELAVLPGREFEYSNMSAAFAGYLGVHAAGRAGGGLNKGYAQLLQENIFDPLQMNRSTIFVSEARSDDNHSLSYVKKNGVAQLATSEDSDSDPFAPAGSIKSSASEMARYLIAVANRGIGPEGNRVVSWEALRPTWKPTRISGTEKYARGWDVRTINNRRVLIHEGAFDNFVSVIMVDKAAKVGLVVLANTEYVGRLLTGAPKRLLKAIRTKKR
jgi:CubicO group peptidase (beta-lactamase class C family)